MMMKIMEKFIIEQLERVISVVPEANMSTVVSTLTVLHTRVFLAYLT